MFYICVYTLCLFAYELIGIEFLLQLVATITHQGHFCPLPLTVQPIIWNFDHCLHLYPTPHTVLFFVIFISFALYIIVKCLLFSIRRGWIDTVTNWKDKEWYCYRSCLAKAMLLETESKKLSFLSTDVQKLYHDSFISKSYILPSCYKFCPHCLSILGLPVTDSAIPFNKVI